MLRLDLRHLILWLCMLSVLLALANGFYASYTVQRDMLIEHTLENNRSYTSKLASATELLMTDIRASLAFSAGELSQWDQQPGALDREVLRLHRQTRHFNSVVIVDHHGKIAAIAPQAPELMGRPLESEGALNSLRAREPITNDPFLGTLGRWVVTLSHPIYDESQTYRGFVAGTIYLHAENVLNHILGLHPYRDKTEVYVVDRRGRLLYHPDTGRIGQEAPQNEAVRASLVGQTGYARIDAPDDLLTGYTHMPSTGWGIVAQRPESDTLVRLGDLLWMTVRNALPLVLLLAALIWWLSRLIARPLGELADIASDIGDPHSSERLEHVRSWYFEAAQLKRALVAGLSSIKHVILNLRRESSTDPLTGLLNRRGTATLLDALKRTGRPYGIISVDIDHFKSINDTYGHTAGDQVLQFLANEMKRTARGDDLLGRQGGEEFLMLTPDASLADTQTLAERLRVAVEAALPPTGKPITISLGVAHVPDLADDQERALALADQALYAAKQHGRNRVCTAPVDPLRT